MLDAHEVNSKYIPTIGIECHVQLNTRTKLFSAVGNDARNAEPNTLISHIDVGLPGALPVLNEKALELAARAAFALNTEPQKFSKFDRKHYFYPDLPKGYQITQFEDPIIKGGWVEINVDGAAKKIRITRVHLEEDAGKNTHPAGADYSLVDLNRAGTPLLEIVSEPEINTAAEAKAFARELCLIMKYAGVSDADLYHGNMRFDVNISLSQEEDRLGKRAEIKNLNSFRSVENAVAFEIDRQTELYEKGQEVVQETRGWDDDRQKTTSQRGKEEAHDYRYMPEPDIPPIELESEFIERIQKDMPDMPSDWRKRLVDLGLDGNQTETLLDVEADINGNHYLKLIGDNLENEQTAKLIANWVINVDVPYTRTLDDPAILIDRNRLYTDISRLVISDKLSSTNAKVLILAVLNDKIIPENIEDYAQAKELIQVSEEAEVEKIVVEVLELNQKAAEDLKNGEMKAIGFLLGQVMAKSQGKANPKVAQKLIKKKLGL